MEQQAHNETEVGDTLEAMEEGNTWVMVDKPAFRARLYVIGPEERETVYVKDALFGERTCLKNIMIDSQDKEWSWIATEDTVCVKQIPDHTESTQRSPPQTQSETCMDVNTIGERQFRFEFYDIPTHEIYHNTHKLFLCSRAVYILVCDLSKSGAHISPNGRSTKVQSRGSGNQSPLEFINIWLSSIASHTGHKDQRKQGEPPVTYPPVVIACICNGNIAGDETTCTCENKIRSLVKDTPFGNGVRVCHINIQQEDLTKTEKELRRFVVDGAVILAKRSAVGSDIRPQLVELEKSLQEEREHLLHINKVKKVAQNICAQEDIDKAFSYLRALGKLAYYDQWVIEPQWVITALKQLLDALAKTEVSGNPIEWKDYTEKGILHPIVIDDIWRDYELGEKQILLSLLVQHKVVFSNPPGACYGGDYGGEGTSPSLLFYHVPSIMPTRGDSNPGEQLQSLHSVSFFLGLDRVDKFHQLALVLSQNAERNSNVYHSQVVLQYEDSYQAVLDLLSTTNEFKISIRKVGGVVQERMPSPSRLIVHKAYKEICSALQAVKGGTQTHLRVECLQPGCKDTHLIDLQALRNDTDPDPRKICIQSGHPYHEADLRVMFGERRTITISVCSSATERNVTGFIAFLQELKMTYPILQIKGVEFYPLPYNDLDKFRFSPRHPVDVMVVCHSIHNRRFAITDVKDSLYGEFLLYSQRIIRKGKIAVIAHDFADMDDGVDSTRMKSFRDNQPTAFRASGLTLTCGQLQQQPVLKPSKREELLRFLEEASTWPEAMKLGRDFQAIASDFFGIGKNTSFQDSSVAGNTSKQTMPTGSGTQNKSTSAATKRKTTDRGETEKRGVGSLQTSRGDVASAPGSVQPVRQAPPERPRPVTVHICTSTRAHYVSGFVKKLSELKEHRADLISDIQLQELPYNDLDGFRFQHVQSNDVMVLCHSINNRGFSITNVTNSLYDKYLRHCNKIFGKQRVAVIVHDFSDHGSPRTQSSRMESFRMQQPLTFELAGTVITCESLATIHDEVWEETCAFLDRAARSPTHTLSVSETVGEFGLMSVVGFAKRSFFTNF